MKPPTRVFVKYRLISADHHTKKSRSTPAPSVTAMTAAFTHSKITQELLENNIKDTRPSISKELLQSYERLREKMEGLERSNALPRIGFKKD